MVTFCLGLGLSLDVLLLCPLLLPLTHFPIILFLLVSSEQLQRSQVPSGIFYHLIINT